jgi:rubrerythrin
MSTSDNLIKVFEYALNQEETGKNFFQASIRRMGVGAAVTAFKKLVQEEEKHIVFINNILKDLKTGGDLNTQSVRPVIIEPTDYFDERARSEFLEQCVAGSMVPDVTVFNVAWLIEKDLAEFYGNAAAQTEGRVSEALGMLAHWEKGHENFFKTYRDKLTETYSKMPWGG